jgi:hypothetical protein
VSLGGVGAVGGVGLASLEGASVDGGGAPLSSLGAGTPYVRTCVPPAPTVVVSPPNEGLEESPLAVATAVQRVTSPIGTSTRSHVHPDFFSSAVLEQATVVASAPVARRARIEDATRCEPAILCMLGVVQPMCRARFFDRSARCARETRMPLKMAVNVADVRLAASRPRRWISCS